MIEDIPESTPKPVKYQSENIYISNLINTIFIGAPIIEEIQQNGWEVSVRPVRDPNFFKGLKRAITRTAPTIR